MSIKLIWRNAPARIAYSFSIFFSCLPKKGNNYHNPNYTMYNVLEVPGIFCYHLSVCNEFNIITPFTVEQFKSRHHHPLAYSKDSSPCKTHGRVQYNSFSTAVWLVLFQLSLPHPVFQLYRRMRIKHITLLFQETII